MPKILQFKRYSSTTVQTSLGVEGELFIDLGKQTIAVMDGVTLGGSPLATEAQVTSVSSTLTTNYKASDSSLSSLLTINYSNADTNLNSSLSFAMTSLSSVVTTNYQAADSSLSFNLSTLSSNTVSSIAYLSSVTATNISTVSSTSFTNFTTLSSNISTVSSVAYSGVSIPDIQTFDVSGTWTKPPNVTMARIQAWGGGGGGGRSNVGNNTGGGGGGGYNEITVPVSQLTTSVSITVALGGTGRTGSTGAGGVGGNTTLTVNGSTWGAYGGGGGDQFATGGSGGGPTGAGSSAGGSPGTPIIINNSNTSQGQGGGGQELTALFESIPKNCFIPLHIDAINAHALTSRRASHADAHRGRSHNFAARSERGAHHADQI